MGSIWHIGIAVPDLEKGKKELGEVFGLRWRPARVRKLTLADAAGRPDEVECHVVFSLGGPFAVEVWQAIPGTPLDVPEAGGVHHIGYWVDDLPTRWLSASTEVRQNNRSSAQLRITPETFGPQWRPARPARASVAI
jgi:catechol 2,3-dioxygenase-like lactoylglutathione lyase family enzyme